MFGNLNPFPLSDTFLESFRPKGRMYDFLAARASKSRSFVEYDFNVKAIDTTNVWTAASGAGTTTWAVRAEAGGWIRGVGGTSSAVSGLQLSIPQKYWTGTSKAGMAIRYRLSDISEVYVGMGFADALPSVNTRLINSLAAPSFNTATAAAAYVYHHTGTTTTTGLYTIGTSSTAARVATTTFRPVNSTSQFVVIEANSAAVNLWIDDVRYPLAQQANGLTPSDGLILFLDFMQLDGNSTNIDIDYIAHWSGRV